MNRKNKQKKSFISKLLIFSNIVLATFLIFAYLSTYVNSDNFGFFAIFGLIYPILLFANLLFVLFWIVRRKKYLLISLIVIIIGSNHLLNSFQINFFNKKTDAETISLMTYNVRLFNRYKWNKDVNTAKDILLFVQNKEPDILCLQEYYSNRKNKKLYFHKKIKNMVKYKDYYISFGTKKGTKYNFGTATYSKYPIINEGTIRYGKENDISIFTDIVYNKDTLRIYNCHFQSIKLGYDDYDLINNVVDKNENNKLMRTLRILKKLYSAYQKRAQQIDIMKKHIDKSPYKTVVCGDFNDMPVSYVYKQISKNYTDAFKRSGHGFGSTYIRDFSFFRIDYILHSKSIKSYDYQCHKVKYSDHYPISCRLVLGKKNSEQE